ncbi:MAG: hypothetical protein HOM46_03555 [Nitrosomonadales bacterium]|jgi:hypothetical protein|nr:hypothetical protein [Nitrosomonadales bacterium]
MVKSSSRPRKASKFTIDLGPEIDRVVKKKLHTRDVKIKKQRVIIKALEQERNELRSRKSEISDLKMKKQKSHVSNLQATVDDLTNKLKEAEKRVVTVEKEIQEYKIQRVNITDKTVDNAFKRLRKGFSLYGMQAETKRRIKLAGRYNEAQELDERRRRVQKKLC